MPAPPAAAIFDLDNCLADSREPGEDLFAPAFEAIAAANHGEVPEARMREAFEACWYTSFDLVARRHGFSRAMHDAGFQVFARLEVTQPMKGYPDLPLLRQLSLPRFLVTSGFQRLQASKVRALGIADWFEQVVIDAVDLQPHKGKRRIFEEILAARGYEPSRVLAIGDNPVSELDAGRKLGMVTVQTLRPGVKRGEADVHVTGLDEVLQLARRG